MLKNYYSLTKSGLVYGNLITVIGGFALGAAVAMRTIEGEGGVFVATLIGISLIMASGCVFNNVIDRDIDALMPRTKERALVTGIILPRAAIIFAAALAAIGFTVLGLFTNLLAVEIALIGFFSYVVLYSFFAKRHTIWGAEVGSISGATPPVVGYVAASGHLDIAAILLFAIMIFWQMPHFYAIAIRRADDYAAANIPVLPIKKNVRRTKFAMFAYIVAFIIAASLLTFFGYAGVVYLVITLLLGSFWLILCLQGFWVSGSEADDQWARKMFFFSLIVMMVLFLTIAVGAIV